jgi:hypothetical protein
MDDLFDILGISLFSSEGKWRSLNDVPCIPLSSCEEYMADGKCGYQRSNLYDEENENNE